MTDFTISPIHRCLIACANAAAGACVCAVMLWMNGWLEIALVSSASAGAATASFLTAQLFGDDKRYGTARAIFGAVLTTALGAAIAGFILAQWTGAFIATITVFAMLITQPPLMFIWIIAMAGVHITACVLRQSAR